LTQLRWSKQKRRRFWTPSQNTISRMQFKMAETLGTVDTRRRGLLRGWWWPVGPKLIFEQTAAPVPEIIDSSLYALPFNHCFIHSSYSYYSSVFLYGEGMSMIGFQYYLWLKSSLNT
jgi:hypothetical protein